MQSPGQAFDVSLVACLALNGKERTVRAATWLYRQILKTRWFWLINWYSRMLARCGITATYQIGREWNLYPIPQLDDPSAW
jgi:hypothetical protein